MLALGSSTGVPSIAVPLGDAEKQHLLLSQKLYETNSESCVR